MKTFNKLLLSGALMAGSIGASGDLAQAQSMGNRTGADTIAELPDNMRDAAILAGTVSCSIAPAVLDIYDVSAPTPAVILDIQTQLADNGYTRGGRDGKFGKYVCLEIVNVQRDEGLFIDGIFGRQTKNALTDTVDGTRGKVETKSTADNTIYTLKDCSGYDDWSMNTIKKVQQALRVPADGRFGDVSCSAVINYQIKNNIAQFGKGAVGTRTLALLGVQHPEKVTATSNTAQKFNPKVDCPSYSSCEILVNLSTQTGKVLVNDNNINTANGRVLFTYPVQSGKPGAETNTGLFRLGPVEYGPNGNPWRVSTLGSSDGEPNLYKFRRQNPYEGGWSGEGTHGSKMYGVGSGSSGCNRVKASDMDIIAQLPTSTLMRIKGNK